jgi:hypothetical protein
VEDIEAAAKVFTDTIQLSGWNATPKHKVTLKAYDSHLQVIFIYVFNVAFYNILRVL